MEENELNEEVESENSVSEEEPKPKQRRKRRTKAQIEVDNAAAQKEAAVNESNVASSNEAQVIESAEEEAGEAVKDNKLSCSVELNCNLDSESVSDETPERICECAEEEESENAAKDRAQQFTATLKVYEAPSEASRSWQRCAKFRVCGRRGNFYCVSFVKPGFGLMRGYVKEDNILR